VQTWLPLLHLDRSALHLNDSVHARIARSLRAKRELGHRTGKRAGQLTGGLLGEGTRETAPGILNAALLSVREGIVKDTGQRRLKAGDPVAAVRFVLSRVAVRRKTTSDRFCEKRVPVGQDRPITEA
jgi:hypothetical protein